MFKNFIKDFIEYVFICLFFSCVILLYFCISCISCNKELNKNEVSSKMDIEDLKMDIKILKTDIEIKEFALEKKDKEIEQMRNICIRDSQLLLNLIEPLKETDKKAYLGKYKYITERYDNIIDPPETVYDCFTKEEINIMLKCIETEAHGCPFDAKVNVACVILNRVENDLFPTDPISVITKNHQFAYGRGDITNDTKLALEYAFMFGNEKVNDCIGFRSDKLVQNWNGWEYYYYDGFHWFYTIKE